MDRTIHFGDSETDARYRIQDTSSTGGDFVLAEDLDGGTVLLEYDYSASEWVSRGPVNLNGNDITNAGSVSADTLEADTLIGADVQNAAVDTVPTSQGDGTLAMESAGEPDWTSAARVTDTDSTTNLSLDTGTFSPDFEQYNCLCSVAGFGNGTVTKLDLTINGVTAGEYDYHKVASGSVSQVNSDSSIPIGFYDRNQQNFSFFVGGSQIEDPETDSIPHVGFINGGTPFGTHVINGRLDGDHPTVNEFAITSNFNATGVFEVFGRDA